METLSLQSVTQNVLNGPLKGASGKRTRFKLSGWYFGKPDYSRRELQNERLMHPMRGGRDTNNTKRES